MAGHGHGRRLPVLIELGHANGRTGIRSIADAISVAEGVVSASHLRLVGVTGYEGTIASTRTVESIAHVDAFLEDLARLARELRSRNLIEAASSPVISAGGSAFFDRVALTFAPLVNIGFRVVLRSGCYLTHDHGLYQSASPPLKTGGSTGLSSRLWRSGPGSSRGLNRNSPCSMQAGVTCRMTRGSPCRCVRSTRTASLWTYRPQESQA